MKEAITGSTADLRAGKGFGIALSEPVVMFLAEALEQVRTLWETVDTPDSFFKELSWENMSDDPKFGARKWVAFVFTAEGDEFRVQVGLSKSGKLRIDFREWYVPH